MIQIYIMSKIRELYFAALVLFAVCLVQSGSALGAYKVLDIIDTAKDVDVDIAKAWNEVDQHIDFSEIPRPMLDRIESRLFGRFNIINYKLVKLGSQVDSVGKTTIALILQHIPYSARIELRLNNLQDHIIWMNINFKNFVTYVKNRKGFQRLTLEDFAKNVISHKSDSVSSLMEKIHDYIVSNGQETISKGLTKHGLEKGTLCYFQQSLQQVFLNLYNVLALIQLKGYAMTQFSYMLLKLYNHGNFTKEAQLVRDRYKERTNDAIETVKQSMENAPRELWSCDPKKHEKGKTYEEITQLLQGYVQNEVDLNSEGTCKENCADYTYTKNYGCYNNLYCKKQRSCKGHILQCNFFDSNMWICPANALSDRRYEYIEFENGRVLGRRENCTQGTTIAGSWQRWLIWQCSYCFCLCDEQGIHSDRYFNMRSTIADIKNNRVVTGLRFVKKNRIIHLQIQEGKLLPRGKIDNNTVHWVPVADYKITDRKIYNEQDYHTLTWSNRAIDLDDLEGDEGYLLTGVRLKMIGSHLNFEIYVTKFDFNTGKLISPSATSFWKDNPNTDLTMIKKPRTKVRLYHPDIPIRTSWPSIPTSRSDQYIEFTHSDIDRDAAQTTVPFIDAQKVESLQAVPLSGAGIFHKGRNNFGGFIAPKIITYDFSKHLKAAYPDKKKN